MRSLHLDVDYDSVKITCSDQGHRIEEQGITHLYIHDYSPEICTEDHTKHLLQKHQSTLHCCNGTPTMILNTQMMI